MLRFLLIKNLEGRSYDETYTILEALPELAAQLGFEREVPAPSTVLGGGGQHDPGGVLGKASRHPCVVDGSGED